MYRGGVTDAAQAQADQPHNKDRQNHLDARTMVSSPDGSGGIVSNYRRREGIAMRIYAPALQNLRMAGPGNAPVAECRKVTHNCRKMWLPRAAKWTIMTFQNVAQPRAAVLHARRLENRRCLDMGAYSPF